VKEGLRGRGGGKQAYRGIDLDDNAVDSSRFRPELDDIQHWMVSGPTFVVKSHRKMLNLLPCTFRMRKISWISKGSL
jgi:hypothetical protein